MRLELSLLSRFLGKHNERDSLHNLVRPSHDQTSTFIEGPVKHALLLLGNASTRFVVDPSCYSREEGGSVPIKSAQITRKRRVSDIPNSPFLIQIQYMDGHGRALQTKKLAESVPDSSEKVRWRCSARTLVNNKGLPVKKFEPFSNHTSVYRPGQLEGEALYMHTMRQTVKF